MRWLRWMVVAVVRAAAAFGVWWGLLRVEPVEVRVQEVARGPVEATVTNTRAGTVQARTRARLSPQIGGLVTGLPHREGERVESGDLLLTLDDRAQRAQAELARRRVTAAEARAEEACLAAELARVELDRTTALHERGIASSQTLDALRTDRDRTAAACAAARAAVTEAAAQVEAAGVELAFTRLEAPFGGIVAEVSTEVGEWITPSPPGVPIPPVIDLLDPRSVYVSAPIDEIDAERVAVGMPVRVTVDSRPDAVLAGRVSRIAPYVLDQLEQNRTVEVEVELEGPVAGLLPGTSADVEIVLDRRDDVLRVPASAVGGGGSVLVLADGVLQERTVRTGLRSWDWVEVLEGLEDGEPVVVVRGSTEVRPGAAAVAAGDGR